MDHSLNRPTRRADWARHGHGLPCLVWLYLGWLGLWTTPVDAQIVGEPSSLFSTCRSQVEADPTDYPAYVCYFLEARRFPRSEHPEVWQAARTQLEDFRASGDDLGLPSLVLGFLAMGDDDPAAVEHFATAALALQAKGDLINELKARTNARKVLFRLGRIAEADEQLRLARRSAESSQNPEALARVLVLSASHRADTGGDLGRSLADLERAAALDLPDDSYRLRSTILFELGRVTFNLGQWDDAIAIYDQLLQLKEDHGETLGLAATALNSAMARQSQLELRPDLTVIPELERRNRRALSLAEQEGNERIIAQSHRVIAEGLISTRPEDARHHLDACRHFARRTGSANIQSSCASTRGRWLLTSDPQEALAVSRQALELAEQTPDSLFEAFAWRALMRAAWEALPRDEALATCLQGLDAIEDLRRAQGDPLARAQLLSNWATDLSWLVGRLLEEETPDLRRAFTIIERLRSRVLLESMSTSSMVREEDPKRLQIRQHIASLQRRLLNPRLESSTRALLLGELERWELEERFLRTDEPMTREATPLVGLDQITAALRPNEAMLSFQVDLKTDFYGQPAGGSWVLVTTSDGSRHHPIADALTLEPAVSAFLGLLQRRDASETIFAERLYGDILAAALQGLPESIERLVLVPDGVLHQLPFAALRPAVGTASLGERFEIVLAPSATLWHRWRMQTVEAPQRSLLALADPLLSDASEEADTTRNAILLNGLQLGRLPHARREGKAILQHVGGQLLMGDEANEHFIKAEDLGRYGIIHFASHAVADNRHAERSSLVLAPGALDEDGLLRAPEIADLDLRGRLVVLSACQTTAGEILKAEGIFSLARAFFEARAHGVIGSRWPLSDEEAAFFFDRFYFHLAEGASSAEALRATRREAIAQGMPAATWAGVSLMGNGDLGVVPEPPPTNTRRLWTITLGTFVLLIASVMWRAWRRS